VALLRALPDAAFAERLRRVWRAAHHAHVRLGAIDLVRHEAPVLQDSADLSLWEDMAPVIRDMVVDVNALLAVMREQFPAAPSVALDRRSRAAVLALQAAMDQIAQGITRLGEAMRLPSVVSDRWNLLRELQASRHRFQELVGELLFETASAFGEVARKDVVPGYEARVRESVVTRAVVSDLTRVIAARKHKAEEAEHEDVQWNAQQLQAELDTFARTGAYRDLRSLDKRRLVELRGRVGQLALEHNPSREELLAVVGEVDALVQGLTAVNQRGVLIVHDRELWAACGVQLERAMALLASDPAAAARALGEATASAQALYGRDPALDAFLRRSRRSPPSSLDADELAATLELFQGLLANLPLG
jgi:hypothetical protein